MPGSGQNFFTITGESFNTISFSTNVDLVADVRQVRLGATLISFLRSMRCSGRSASAQTRAVAVRHARVSLCPCGAGPRSLEMLHAPNSTKTRRPFFALV